MDLDGLLGPDDVDTEDFVLSLTFECLSDTPKSMKNPLFSSHVKKYTDVQQLASDIELLFPPGLGTMLKGNIPPSVAWFKTLPTGPAPGFIVYLLVLTKRGCRPKIYIGSGTNARSGGDTRLEDYDNWTVLPSLVKAALDDGYIIAHKGLLAWTPTLPRPGLAPRTRLLFLALEATFTYNFWAMRAYKKDYGMGHMCLWPRLDLEYDGLCTRCCLYEGIRRNFDLSDEQLEEVAALRTENLRKRQAFNTNKWRKEFRERDPEGFRAWTAASKSDYHYRQMAYNYDEYATKRVESHREYRANNPDKYEAEKKAVTASCRAARANKEHFCATCNIPFGEARHLADHLTTPSHNLVANCDRTSPLFCVFCTYLYSDKKAFKNHLKSQRHIGKVAAAQAEEMDLD